MADAILIGIAVLVALNLLFLVVWMLLVELARRSSRKAEGPPHGRPLIRITRGL